MARKKPIQKPIQSRTITIKDVPEDVFQTFNTLPRGIKGAVLVEVLRATARFAEDCGESWSRCVLAGTLELH